MPESPPIQLLTYPHEFLDLPYTLACGQAFRWKQDDEGWWGAPVGGKVIRINAVEEGFLWQTYPGDPDFDLLSSVFRLDTDVPSIYELLAASDAHVGELVTRFSGLRLLRQDPEECLLSYTCSTANSVPRISHAVECMSSRYGEFIWSIGGRDYYSFPTVEALATADPNEVNSCANLGWRGNNVVEVARQMLMQPEGWPLSLRGADYGVAKSELMSIRGIGAKIADCVALFSLDKDEAVPVDTHIRQVAVRYFMPELKTKTITAAAYDKITLVFWSKFGKYAGWAQEFLFYEDLLRSRKGKGIHQI